MASPSYPSWGRYPQAGQTALRYDWPGAEPGFAGNTPCLPRGNGRSYGDVCLNDGGVLLDCRGLNRFIAFDEASGVLRCEAGVLLAPAKAANAGGVAVSGLEQSQNAIRISWSHGEVDQRLRTIMNDIHARCVEYGSKNGEVDYVDGANVAGFVKVADAMVSYGVV